MKIRKIIIGISAGIAGYKTVDLIRLYRKHGYEITVIMTENAQKMFGSEIFEKASGNKVYTGKFIDNASIRQVLNKKEVEHIKLADSTDMIVVVPATANLIAKIAHGIADDLLTAVLLATKAPIIVCPSMNTNMWNNPIFQRNLEQLSGSNIHIIPPVYGNLACGYIGMGKLAKIEEIFSKIKNIINQMKSLEGRKVIVTAGATREYLDGVRYLSNKGSGKMGVAIALACRKRGAKVLMFKAQSSVLPDYGLETKEFDTIEDLYKLVRINVAHYEIIFHTASVSDFTLDKITAGKIKSGNSMQIDLQPAVKILHKFKILNPKIKVVGFKAVFGENEENMVKTAQEKLALSKADYIVVNDVGRTDIGFGVDNNEVVIVSKKGDSIKIPKDTKDKVAEKIVDIVNKKTGRG